ncbi:MAG: cytochrome c [Rhodospirillaceae bacterium]
MKPRAFALIVIAVAAAAGAAGAAEPSPGEALYWQHCARCHGSDLRGEPDWQTPAANGRIKAPPHDESGHTWMHAESELLALIRSGRGGAAAPGSVSDMPNFGGRLSDDEIRAVLAFIAGHWPPGHRAYQMMLEPDFDPARLPAGDWQLPRMCLPQK